MKFVHHTNQPSPPGDNDPSHPISSVTERHDVWRREWEWKREGWIYNLLASDSDQSSKCRVRHRDRMSSLVAICVCMCVLVRVSTTLSVLVWKSFKIRSSWPPSKKKDHFSPQQASLVLGRGLSICAARNGGVLLCWCQCLLDLAPASPCPSQHVVLPVYRISLHLRWVVWLMCVISSQRARGTAWMCVLKSWEF